MRIFFAALVIILGANLGIDLMNSNMVDLIQERNNQMQRAIDRM
jgi:hypothetical protein